LSRVKNLAKRVGKLLLDIFYLPVPTYAANAGFFLILSVFPALVLLLGLMRNTGFAADALTELVTNMVPAPLQEIANRLINAAYRNTSGTVVSLSAVAALWSASRGVYGLLTGLNAVYKVSENRGYVYTRSISVLYTFLLLMVMLLTLVVHVFGSGFWNKLYGFSSVWGGVVDLRFIILLIFQILIFTGIYMALPNGHNSFIDSLPGGMLTAAGWLILSDLVSLYVEHFPSYANIYGSVYAVAVAMLWVYFCMMIILYGGVLNHSLKAARKKRKDAAA